MKKRAAKPFTVDFALLFYLNRRTDYSRVAPLVVDFLCTQHSSLFERFLFLFSLLSFYVSSYIYGVVIVASVVANAEEGEVTRLQ